MRQYFVYPSPDGVKPTLNPPLWVRCWRASVALFLAWFIVFIVEYMGRRHCSGAQILILLSLLFAVFHYATLATMGLPITLLPLSYSVESMGKAHYFVDIGQLIIAYALWQSVNLRKLKVRVKPRAARRRARK